MPDHRPSDEFRTRLGAWFVTALTDETSTAERPLEPVPVGVAPRKDERPDSPSHWLQYAALLLLIGGVVASVAFAGLREVPSDPPVASSPPTASSPPVAGRDVSSELDSVCAAFASAIPAVPWGVSRSDATELTGPFSESIDGLVDRLDGLASSIPGGGLDDVTRSLERIRARVAALPTLAGPSELDRLQFDQEVASIDVLVLDWGRAMRELGAEDCRPPTLRER